MPTDATNPTNSYRRPAAHHETTHTLEIKRSKFITFITRIETEAQARDFISDLKNRYPDARHHCSAYIYHVDGANPVERSSDDGEPSGTAGTPMLDALRGSGLLDIAAVTVRYFGGIKLGAGGLIHAYSDSVLTCLTHVSTVTRSRKELYLVELPFDIAGRVEATLRTTTDITVIAADYTAAGVTLTLATDPETSEQLNGTISALTAGQATLVAAGTDWVE